MSIQFSSYIRVLTDDELVNTLKYMSARKRSEELADKAGVLGAGEVLRELEDQIEMVKALLDERGVRA